MRSGKVQSGKIVVDGDPLLEGSTVTVLEPDDGDTLKRVERVATRLGEHLRAGKPLTQQHTASELVNALPYLPRLKNPRINVAQAELALEALLADPPNDKLAHGIVEGHGGLTDRVTIFKSTWRSVWEGRTIASHLLLGLAAHLASAASVFFAVCAFAPTWRIWSQPSSIVPWVFIGGSLGGVVSLVTRLHDFAVMERWAPEADPRLLFYTGLLKPAASIVFSLFAWTALKAGLFKLAAFDQSADQSVIAFTLAFVAGFSERMAPDIANRARPPVERPEP